MNFLIYLLHLCTYQRGRGGVSFNIDSPNRGVYSAKRRNPYYPRPNQI